MILIIYMYVLFGIVFFHMFLSLWIAICKEIDVSNNLSQTHLIKLKIKQY